MATQQTADVFITNKSGEPGLIQLYHNNSSNGTQSAAWANVAPGATVGPLTVHFETGFGSYGILDYWKVRLLNFTGRYTAYTNSGSATSSWKECQLQHADAGKTITLTVDTENFAIDLPSGGCQNSMEQVDVNIGGSITNVFVLMLENHSFDNMFAMSGIPGILAATTADSNAYDGQTYRVQGGAPVSMVTDPGHEFPDVVEQLGGQGATYPPGGPYPPITNAGFAANYATTTSEGPVPPAANVGDIMKALDPGKVPVINELAREFAICDQWFSSLPGPTWPNRFFLHGASSAGLDHSPTTAQMAAWETYDGFSYPNGSIFAAMNDAKASWRLYIDRDDQFTDHPGSGSVFGAIPQVASLKGITVASVNSFSHFAEDLQNPYDYQYTFIEPNYGDIRSGSYEGGSSQHPMDDTYGGEGLIKATYEAIRRSPLWFTSLLIVIYDEHGGFYDHLAPPSASAPDDNSSSEYNEYGFTFDRLGVRVPAVVVSPLIPKGTVDPTVYDHSSVLATLEKSFAVSPLTQRDATAKNVLPLLTVSPATPRTDCPSTLTNPVKAAVPDTAAPSERVATDGSQPLPKGGNLPGFLNILLKTQLELANGDEADRAAIIAAFGEIKTEADAEAYGEKVAALVQLPAREEPQSVPS